MLLSITAHADEKSDETKTVKSDRFHFAVEYPKDWELRQSFNESVATQVTLDSKVPDTQVWPTFQVVVTGEKLPASDLKDAVKASQEFLKKSSPNVTFSANEDAQLDGVAAIRFGFEKLTMQSQEMRGFRYVVIQNGRLYVISLYCSAAQYDRFNEAADKAAKSIKWTK